MTQQNALQIFEAKKVRTIWDDEQEKWYFSIVDVIEVLTDNERPRKYWSDLKSKLKKEGSELSEKIGQLKMQSSDGKFYKTDVADTEQLFRLIQSIPSPKAEPFKLWLAKIANERLDEMQNPELTVERAMYEYLQLGYSESWINQRLKSIEIRKELTDEWKKRNERRTSICCFNGYYYQNLVRKINQRIQKVERLEKRKSSRSYDKYRVDFKYVSRSIN